MTAGAAIVIAVRLLVPLMILRRPLFGAVASLMVDALDVVFISVVNLGGFGGHYHTTDKLLDTYYLLLELVVALRWQNAYARWIAAALFPYRLAGVVLFELTGQRVMLLIFPNLFENWWLYCAFTLGYAPQLSPRSWREASAALVILLVPKLGQEYLLHYLEARPWDWIKRVILRDRV
jgi:hypothetical protein